MLQYNGVTRKHEEIMTEHIKKQMTTDTVIEI